VSTALLDSSSIRLAERVFAPLARLRRQCRLYLALDGTVQLVFAFILAGLVQLVLDWWLRLSIDQRALLNLVITGIWLIVIYRRVALPLSIPLSDRALAAAVDRANPQLHDALATAVQFASGQVGDAHTNSPQLMRAVLAETCDAVADVRFPDVLNHARARHRAIELVGLLALPTLAWGIMPTVMNTWFARNWLVQDIPWPQRTRIVPDGFDVDGRRRAPRGDELELVAQIEGDVPELIAVTWQTPSGRRGRETMTRVGFDRLHAALGVLSEDLRFRISGGDEHTREYTVQAVERPQVIGTLIRITPPDYAGLEPVVLEQQTSAEMLRGSSVEVQVTLNKPVIQADFVEGPTRIAEAELVAPDRARVHWASPETGAYEFALVDADGWEDRRPVRFMFKVVPDRPPSAQLELVDLADVITPSAESEIQLQFRDAYGLGAVGVSVQVNDAPPFDLTTPGFTVGVREFLATVPFRAPDLGLKPGDRVRLQGVAEDRSPDGPNVTRSDFIDLRVLSVEDYLAEVSRRELELRREFEVLISAQKGLGEAVTQLLPGVPTTEAAPSLVAQRIVGVSRRQESHAARSIQLAQRFAQILAQMIANRVARAGDERRLHDRIIEPLNALGHQSMPAAAAGLAGLRDGADSSERAEVASTQSGLLREMQSILANMQEWEGYREAIALLQDIITTQGELRSQTAAAIESQLDEILRPEVAPPATAPNRPAPP
jgi:hypothetical protein